MGKRASRTSRGPGAAIAATLVLCLVASPALCKLINPSVHGLAVGANEVAVRVGTRVLFFDHDGAFRRELPPTELPMERAQLLALTDDGRLWFALAEENESGDVKATTVTATDESGVPVLRHRLAGDWAVYVSPRGHPFVGRVKDKRLRIERLDAASGRLSLHAEIGIEKALRILDLDAASAVSWAVDEQGDLFVLTAAAERGRVTRYRPSGEQVRVWEVLPDPVTSVSYMKDVFLDRDGVPYVTHSSWEVSSSTSNSGSVLRLDPAGGEALRIKESVGYLQHAAVSPSGDVFVSDLSKAIYRFSSAGEPVVSWVAVPPQYGESWEERRQLMAEAARIEPSATAAELVKAVLYGEGEISQKAARLLLAKGPSALPEVTAAVVRFGEAYSLARAAERLWEAHPKEAARLFEETKEEPVRRALAPFLAYVEAPPRRVREVLSRMVLEGDDSARHALNHLGPMPEVVRAHIAAWRRAVRNGESPFDVEWDLSHGYPWSISALEAILVDPADPDRRAARSLMLEASRELASDSGSRQEKPSAIPDDVLARTRSWVVHPDPFVRETGAIALTSFAVSGQEAEAIAAARRNPTLLLSTLKAFAVLAAAHLDDVAPHVEALSLLARSSRSPEPHEDALTELAKIPHPAVAERCLLLLSDESLPAERRSAILLGLRPSVLPRPSMVALLRDQAWQRSLSREYFYYSFLDDVAAAYPTDAEIRAETKNALLAILSDSHLDLTKHIAPNDMDARAMALASLRPLVVAADLPRLVPLLDDPRLERSSRWQLLSVLSRVPPDDELRERMTPLLKDPDLALIAAQSLGRAGHPAALEVLVEQGLKRLGYYSRIELEIESFRPLGPDAEQALLSLLDYPNSGTRAMARRFLLQWPSTEGRRRIRAELDEAIESGRAPEDYTLWALSQAGEDVVEPLLKLAMEHPEALEALPPEHPQGPLTEQLRQALATETDPARARALGTLVHQLCSCDGE